MMTEPQQNRTRQGLNILIIDDNEDDAALMEFALRKKWPDAHCTMVDSREAMLAALNEDCQFDLVISDWSLPQFSGLDALKMLKRKGVDAPFILVSGKIGEESAVQAIREGTYDYVLKNNLTRLPIAAEHALQNKAREKAEQKLVEQLHLQATGLKAIPIAIAILSSDGIIESVNPAFKNLTGYAPEEVIGRSVSEFCYSGFCMADFQTWKGSDIKTAREIERRKDGSLYLEERTICPVYNDANQLTHFIAAKTDVTAEEQRKRHNELELLYATISAQASNSSLLIKRTLSFIAEQFPASEPGFNVYASNHETLKTTWYGTPHEKDDHLFTYEIHFFDQSFGKLVIGYSPVSALQEFELYAAIAKAFESALLKLAAKERVESQIKKISFLSYITKSINSVFDADLMLGNILKQSAKLLDADTMALYLYNKETKDYVCRAHYGFKSINITGVHIAPGQPYVGTAASEQQFISCYAFDNLTDQEQFLSLIKEEKFLSQHCAPIVVGGVTLGVLEVFQRKEFTLSDEWVALLDAIAMQTGAALEYNTVFLELQSVYRTLENSYEATIEGWSSAMDLRDQETEGHSKRVTSLTVAFATRLGFSQDDIVRAKRGALLHDIGKIGIPDSILRKNGPLTEEEWAIMKEHPSKAYGMLHRIPYLRNCLDIPLCHHEKWDGTGYPQGLKGEKIPLAARMFALIDVYDALTSDRPYRKAWTKEKALEYIREQAGKHFDPNLTEAFIALIKA
ncbi:MAG: HD domain-containing protein [Spirochaetia bacterium]|nr:HD domain-containing protein [Spirochaetia bacterium]